MSKDLLEVVDAVANEKGVDREAVFAALETALAAAVRRSYDDRLDVRVSLDRTSGTYEAHRRWLVLPEGQELVDPEVEIALADARAKRPGVEPGEYVEEPLAVRNFGRIAAQAAKQVIVHKVREAERSQLVRVYKDRVGQLVTGTVKRVERGNVYLELNTGAEAIIPRTEMIPRQRVNLGDRLRGYLKAIDTEARGPQLIVSRTDTQLLVELFRLEVPEIAQGIIEIKAAARDPGQRAKIAVMSHDPRIEPEGACIGMRGSRVQAVTNELAGERIDIIAWDESLPQLVINAMKPAEVRKLTLDDATHSIEVAVDEDRLSLAIGRGGQNVRLASLLTGWQINVISVEQAEERQRQELEALQKLFTTQLNVDEDLAGALSEYLTTVEEVAYLPTAELLKIPGLDETLVEQLRERARDALLTQAIAQQEEESRLSQAGDLLEVEGLERSEALRLLDHDIKSREELAELAADELAEMLGVSVERAGALVMAARSVWFEAPAAAGEGGAS
jgi:N utilization substance protein A